MTTPKRPVGRPVVDGRTSGGNVNFRASKANLRRWKSAADRRGQTLTQWAHEALDAHAGKILSDTP